MSRPVINERYRERTPWTLDELQELADVMGIDVAELMARPKGFEPLTFWLGADHTLTGFRPGGGWEHLFCDACGDLGRYGAAAAAEALGDVHAMWSHGGDQVERAS